MQSLRPAARGSTKLLALLLAAGLLGALTPGSAGAENKRVITVMTRNLYLGTDLDPIIGAPDLPSLLQAVDDGFANVVATDFPTRAGAIADEIADTQPDLVGLQEVSLWRTDVPPDGEVSPAETVAFDFLQILLGAMEARGLSYAPVVSVDNFDAEVPAGFPPTMDVRLTDRDVILARTDLKTAELMLSNPMAANFETAATIPDTPIGTITIPRGWTSVDVKLRGKEFRLVNTHLEVASFPLGLVQVDRKSVV